MSTDEVPFIAKPNFSNHKHGCRSPAPGHTGKQITAEVKVCRVTVSRILRRLGLNRMRNLDPADPESRVSARARRDHSHGHQKIGRFERVGHRITVDASGPNNSRDADWGFRPRLY